LAHLESYWGWKEALEQHRQLVNRWFDLGLVTRERVREYKWAGSDGNVYSPVDLGELGWIGDISDVERGEGRWQWLLRDLANWEGKKILDLGANNCLYAIRALQRGAEEVHCVEIDADTCEAARLLKQAVEQTDSNTLNIHIHHSDIHSFLINANFPRDHFDITMALCSIYYLSREEISECMKIISRISKECWLQGNSETEREDADLFKRASREFLEGQLRHAGFSDVTVIAPDCYRKKPRQYYRPLLIGKKPPTAKVELARSHACVG
jgi:SAM-dependent methyltransferase